MNSYPDARAVLAGRRDHWRGARYAVRVPLLLVHIVVGLPATLVLIKAYAAIKAAHPKPTDES